MNKTLTFGSFNKLVNHPLQSYEWGDFRIKTGVKVIRKEIINEKTHTAFQLTIHNIPHTHWTIGYIPKGILPTRDILSQLYTIGKEEKCIFIQLEPHVQASETAKRTIENLGLRPSFHPLFTKYTFQLDLGKSEDELLKSMHHKTRYNIKVAQKYGVVIQEDNSDTAFAEYLRLTNETTKRQKFYAHTNSYHRLMWETLRYTQGELLKDTLTAHLLVAKYQSQILATWILFVFKDTLYYPYGASASIHRHTMASNLMMWQVILFGKRLGLKTFDMWGALGSSPDIHDPWYGFHRFKEGYGPRLVEFIGSYDLVIHPNMYRLYTVADKARWAILRVQKIFS